MNQTHLIVAYRKYAPRQAAASVFNRLASSFKIEQMTDVSQTKQNKKLMRLSTVNLYSSPIHFIKHDFISKILVCWHSGQPNIQMKNISAVAMVGRRIYALESTGRTMLLHRKDLRLLASSPNLSFSPGEYNLLAGAGKYLVRQAKQTQGASKVVPVSSLVIQDIICRKSLRCLKSKEFDGRYSDQDNISMFEISNVSFLVSVFSRGASTSVELSAIRSNSLVCILYHEMRCSLERCRCECRKARIEEGYELYISTHLIDILRK